MEKDIGIGIAKGVVAGVIESGSLYVRMLFSSAFLNLNRALGNFVISDYTEDTWLARFIAACPSLFKWIASDLFDIELHGDDPENLSVYFARVTGGTSIRNLEF